MFDEEDAELAEQIMRQAATHGIVPVLLVSSRSCWVALCSCHLSRLVSSCLVSVDLSIVSVSVDWSIVSVDWSIASVDWSIGC